MKIDFVKALTGGDLRSKGLSEVVASKVKSQKDFDDLFNCLFSKDRLVVRKCLIRERYFYKLAVWTYFVSLN